MSTSHVVVIFGWLILVYMTVLLWSRAARTSGERRIGNIIGGTVCALATVVGGVLTILILSQG